MPGQLGEGGSGDGMYYSWNYGAIHFCAMNSESPIDTPMFTESELSWVNYDLSNVDRTATPWVFAHFHRPFYCAKDEDCGSLLVQQGGEEVLYQNKVDVVLTAHEHTYERTYPVYNHTQQDGAPIYLLQGGSGNREGNNGNYPPLDELPSWVAATYNQIGFGVLTQSADGSEVSWKYIESATKKVLDSVSWVKK